MNLNIYYSNVSCENKSVTGIFSEYNKINQLVLLKMCNSIDFSKKTLLVFDFLINYMNRYKKALDALLMDYTGGSNLEYDDYGELIYNPNYTEKENKSNNVYISYMCSSSKINIFDNLVNDIKKNDLNIEEIYLFSLNKYEGFNNINNSKFIELCTFCDNNKIKLNILLSNYKLQKEEIDDFKYKDQTNFINLNDFIKKENLAGV